MNTQLTQQLWSVRRLVILGFATLTFLIAGFGTWVVQAELSGAIIAEGRLSETRSNQLIQHIDGGVARDILVKEGDHISANATLIRLEDGPTLSELRIVETRLFEVLARRNRLEAERDNAAVIVFDSDLMSRSKTHSGVADLIEGQKRLFNARNLSAEQETVALLKKSTQIRIQIEGINAQLSALRTQLSLATEQLNRQRALSDQGLARANSVFVLQEKTAIIRGKTGAFIAERAEAQAKIAGIEIEILLGKSQHRENAINQLRDLEFRQSELSEKRRALQVRLDNHSIRSPIDGVVFGLGSISPKSVVRPAEVLMQIAPQEQRYVIVARIAPTQIDQVFDGQPVRLEFASLEIDDTNDLYGQVSQISADALTDNTTSNTYFSVEIRPSNETLAWLSGRENIYPGLPVQLYIRTSDQPAWRYLAKPLLGYITRALRES